MRKYIGKLIRWLLGTSRGSRSRKFKLAWEKYMRIRFLLDISKPLVREKKIQELNNLFRFDSLGNVYQIFVTIAEEWDMAIRIAKKGKW